MQVEQRSAALLWPRETPEGIRDVEVQGCSIPSAARVLIRA